MGCYVQKQHLTKKRVYSTHLFKPFFISQFCNLLESRPFSLVSLHEGVLENVGWSRWFRALIRYLWPAGTAAAWTWGAWALVLYRRAKDATLDPERYLVLYPLLHEANRNTCKKDTTFGSVFMIIQRCVGKHYLMSPVLISRCPASTAASWTDTWVLLFTAFYRKIFGFVCVHGICKFTHANIWGCVMRHTTGLYRSTVESTLMITFRTKLNNDSVFELTWPLRKAIIYMD